MAELVSSTVTLPSGGPVSVKTDLFGIPKVKVGILADDEQGSKRTCPCTDFIRVCPV